ncbi:MAG: transcription-repair coupling factor [Bacteroidota bacterium]
MNIQNLIQLFQQDEKTAQIVESLHSTFLLEEKIHPKQIPEASGKISSGYVNELTTGHPCYIHLKGITGSAHTFIASAVAKDHSNTHLFVLSDKEEAACFLNDMENLSDRVKAVSRLPADLSREAFAKWEASAQAGDPAFTGADSVLFFPPSYKHPDHPDEIDNTNVGLRTEVFVRINKKKDAMKNTSRDAMHRVSTCILHRDSTCIVTYPEALSEKVVSQKQFSDNTIVLTSGEKVSIDFITELLNEYGFEYSDFVNEPGQFSVRGGIVDVFSFSHENPYRIEFFGDEVDSIRTFDIATQLSVKKLDQINIIPDLSIFNNQYSIINQESFLQFIPDNTTIWFKDFQLTVDKLKEAGTRQSRDVSGADGAVGTSYLVSPNDFINELKKFSIIEFGNQFFFDPHITIKYNISPQPAFNKNFKLLTQNLNENIKKGFKNIILTDSSKQIERLYAIFEAQPTSPPTTLRRRGETNLFGSPHWEEKPAIKESSTFEWEGESGGSLSPPAGGRAGEGLFTPILLSLHEGFIDKDLKIACYTDHQIFDRYHRFGLKRGFGKKEAITLKEFHNLKPSDFVVHIDHGIGKFEGLEKIDNNGKPQEAIRLSYKDGDILYVSIHSLHRISKYSGKEGFQPKLNKLGSANWNKLKQKTKKKVRDIAKDLIKLYANRKSQEGFEFSPDTYIQNELEASFIYEDTPDQLNTTKDVKQDMELPVPMDRLVCGDVGFGKTEIAIRAALKAVADSKQVAVLVPTTILALQHYKTFRERLEEFPCNIDYLNRFKSAKQQKETLKKLETGQIDIIIGTHRLISKDVKFKDIGLLIIDEEQKFGVATKEKLKSLKVNVDTLTLTATPIPRTLQFSLMSARDMSIINTPPPNRYPIQTELHSFNEEVIREAILYEVSRNGQVFFVHNRVQNIEEIAGMVRRVCPEARVAIGHGQMEGRKLEKVMIDFIEQEYDVLVATTIIESGLDIPNANTIIINYAHQYGLSDLHQMRGRVGRSNKKAFCYLLAPPVSTLTNEARKRLHAIEDFSELGSGFNIALRDLDIRGAGNLLGAEQSGFINELGFNMYHKILDEAVQELKSKEFEELFKEPEDKGQLTDEIDTRQIPRPTVPRPFIKDCQIDTDMEILIPDDYVNNITERMSLYEELNGIKKPGQKGTEEDELFSFKNKLIDRFGPLPKQTEELLNTMRLRWLSEEIGFEKLILKQDKLICYFISDKDSPYYQSDLFLKILDYIRQHPASCRMKESKNKLSLSFDVVDSIDKALAVLRPVL